MSQRPSDEGIHAMAAKRMAAQPNENPNPRRHDTPVFVVEKRDDLKQAVTRAIEAVRENPEGPSNPRRTDAPLAPDAFTSSGTANDKPEEPTP